MINYKESNLWYIEFFKTPCGIYHRVFKKWGDINVFEYDIVLKEEINFNSGDI